MRKRPARRQPSAARFVAVSGQQRLKPSAIGSERQAAVVSYNSFTRERLAAPRSGPSLHASGSFFRSASSR